MELIIAILFFSLASTVCIQLFAKSHLISRDTVNQNHAVTYAQNLAEAYIATEGDLSRIQTLFRHSKLDSDSSVVSFSFDKEWNIIDSPDASYIARLEGHQQDANGLISADITIISVENIQEPLFSLHIRHHIAERRNSFE